MKYNICICTTDKNIKFMIQYITKFLSIEEKRYVGIDFEFNRVNNIRRVALCQLNLEIKSLNEHYIFLFYPPDITKISNIFLELLVSTNIVKILHGGESLDIPYLFSEVLINRIDRDNFLINLFDTKYMCEYYNVSNKLTENKCRIYELLRQMNVISKDKLEMLNNNDKKMGNIWEIELTVSKLSDRVIVYCLYDVIYLPELFKKFPKNDIYRKLLPAINNFNLLYRFDNTLNKFITNISKYNTNSYIVAGDKFTFNDIYLTIYIWLDSYKQINNLFQLNYFKKSYEIFIKDVLYRILSNKYKSNLDEELSNNKVLLNFLSELNDKIKCIF